MYKRSRALLNLSHGCPELVVRRVVQRLKTGIAEVLTQREPNAVEVARAEAATGRPVNSPYYIDESAALSSPRGRPSPTATRAKWWAPTCMHTRRIWTIVARTISRSISMIFHRLVE